MNSFNNDQHLNSEELREYKQGNLSNKEMHRLELHMIDCELCTDALEGLSKVEANIFTASLESIKARTGAEQKFEINQKQWLAIAASIVLLTVVSLVFYNWPSDTEILLAEESGIEDKTVIAIDDSATQTLSSSDSSVSEEAKQEDLIAAVVEEPETEKEEIRPATAPTETTVDLDVAMAENDSEFILEEEIMDDSTMVTIATTEEDSSQGLSARSKKAAISPSESASGETELAEGDVIIHPQPKKGQRSYDRYLNRKLQYPENARANNIEGEVVLQLNFDASGDISDIRVTKSLGYGCDEEAIRLIKEGPSWDAAKRNGIEVEDVISVIVVFKL